MRSAGRAVSAMIKVIKRVTASAVWEIDGASVPLQRRRNIPEAKIISKIVEYKRILQERAYESNNACLLEMFQFFGGVSFIKIGMVYEDAFLECFSYYAKIFAEEWAAGDCRLHSKNIGYPYVFQNMLDPIKYDFRYILDEIPDSERFCRAVDSAFEEYWTPVVESLMREGKPLHGVGYRVGDVRLSKYMMAVPWQIESYLSRLAGGYTKRREIISLRKLHCYIFGYGSRSNFAGGCEGLFALMKSVVEKEHDIQCVKFIAENRIAMDAGLDTWVLYQTHGVRLKYMVMDFTQIRQASMRIEIKYFLKNRFSGTIRTSDRIFGAITDAVNRICDHNASIIYFADIDTVDVKALQLSMETDGCTQTSIMAAFTALRVMMDYLCGGERADALKTPVPQGNPFRGVTFVNALSYSKNTPYIPDSILTELEKYVDTLNETDRLVFRIFNETGMRAKEVVYLREDCLKKARYDGFVELKYIAYKVIKARRRAGLGDYHSVYISAELAAEISKQIKESAHIRKQCGLPYIFLHQNAGYKMTMYDVTYFIVKINKLIKKHNIRDESGELWNFTSRQCRKTLVVDMIENGATVEELVYQLGHLSQSTAMKYYAEVKDIKLAALNSEFFRKQFEVNIDDGQLCEYTEEERRLLHVDFCLGYRRVEMGFCVRKNHDGACRHMNVMYHCVCCPKLCTGAQYLPYWQRLFESEKKELETMLEKYKRNNIADHSGFVEFKRKCSLVAAYQDIVSKLQERQDSSV